jgi:endonuclease/exonuclease/phosphatase family metal-dependent hydrolase
MLCGDFNLIYQADDKNNGRHSRRMMGRFCHFLNDLEFLQLHLHGRFFTWSNERTHPTLEWIDRVFVSSDWELLFPSFSLQDISSRCSDHSPSSYLLKTAPSPSVVSGVLSKGGGFS